MNNFTPIEIHPDAHLALEPILPLFEWIGPRWDKALTLYTLARSCERPIIEIGTYHGLGTIALALGARDGLGAHVYTVDPFVDYTGWIGDHYDEEDLIIFEDNVSELGLARDITLLRDSSENVVHSWTEPYDLLFWDIGGKRLIDDYMDWYIHCAPGGLFAIKDLRTWGFGLQNVIDHALDNGFTQSVSNPKGTIWTLRKD